MAGRITGRGRAAGGGTAAILDRCCGNGRSVNVDVWETEFFDLWRGIIESNDQHIKIFKLVRNQRQPSPLPL